MCGRTLLSPCTFVCHVQRWMTERSGAQSLPGSFSSLSNIQGHHIVIFATVSLLHFHQAHPSLSVALRARCALLTIIVLSSIFYCSLSKCSLSVMVELCISVLWHTISIYTFTFFLMVWCHWDRERRLPTEMVDRSVLAALFKHF